jgi:phage baseplate assembly protein W
MSEVSDFRGCGWRFPLVPGAGGGFSYVSGQDNITQSLRILLRTVLGERLMRADFGTAAPEMLFDADSDQNLHRLEDVIADAVGQWEPRVALESVLARRSPSDDTEVEVVVVFRVLSSNTKDTLVFPYYLATVRAVP